jgi:hypothetical protein
MAPRPTHTTSLVRLLTARYGRILIAIDHDGRFHVRKTLSVTHDEATGDARYDAKPIASGDSLLAALRAALAVRVQSTPRGEA